MPQPRLPVLALAGTLALAACAGDGDVTEFGITTTRSACPLVSVPTGTGDVTLLAPGRTDAGAIDVVASITALRSGCVDEGTQIAATATYTVAARRSDAAAARTVALPVYSTVVQGGRVVVAKRVGQATLNFAPGQLRAETAMTAGARVDRAAATLPEDIRKQITRRRKSGQADAAIDPLAVPEVRAAVERATFELLVGFQLTDEQLAYNATR